MKLIYKENENFDAERKCKKCKQKFGLKMTDFKFREMKTKKVEGKIVFDEKCKLFWNCKNCNYNNTIPFGDLSKSLREKLNNRYNEENVLCLSFDDFVPRR